MKEERRGARKGREREGDARYEMYGVCPVTDFPMGTVICLMTEKLIIHARY